jgi:hypothetical protein
MEETATLLNINQRSRCPIIRKPKLDPGVSEGGDHIDGIAS